MRRVPYDGRIRHKALTHRFSAKDDICVMFAWTFILLCCTGCVRVLACMCARFSFIKKIPTGNSHTLSSR